MLSNLKVATIDSYNVVDQFVSQGPGQSHTSLEATKSRNAQVILLYLLHCSDS